MSKTKRTCAYPNCNQICRSKGRKGIAQLENSFDKSKRQKWCKFHLTGKGKEDRLRFSHENRN